MSPYGRRKPPSLLTSPPHMKKVQFKTFTLYIQFFGFEQVKKDIQLPFYPKAWRKHPDYDQAFKNEIANVAMSLGLAPTTKHCCYSLI